VNTLVGWLLGLGEGVPWPWKLILVAGMPLSIGLLVARCFSFGLLLAEGRYATTRRRDGVPPSDLHHAVSDGLDLWGIWLWRLTPLPIALSFGLAILLALGGLAEADWALDAEHRMMDYADRVVRAE
jgi:hypothetical protein